MPENVEANGAEVSDAMSENEYDDIDHPVKEDEDEKMAEHTASPEPDMEGSAEVKKKYDPKDPHRPRRKKARRACYACQRAHLTCGKSQFVSTSCSWQDVPWRLRHPRSHMPSSVRTATLSGGEVEPILPPF